MNRAHHNQLRRIDNRNNRVISFGCKYAWTWFSGFEAGFYLPNSAFFPISFELQRQQMMWKRKFGNFTSNAAHWIIESTQYSDAHCFIRCHFIWCFPNIAIGTLVYYKIIEHLHGHNSFQNGTFVWLKFLISISLTHRGFCLCLISEWRIFVYLFGCVNQTQNPHN